MSYVYNIPMLMQRCIIVLLPPLQSGSFVPFSHLLHPLKLSHVALEEHFEQSEINLSYVLRVDINTYILKLHVTTFFVTVVALCCFCKTLRSWDINMSNRQ